MLENYFIILAILSSFFASIANILAKVLLKDLEAKNILSINFFTMWMVLLLISPLFYKFEASFLGITLIVFISLIDTIANFFYFKTLKNTETSIATPILSLSPWFTFLFWFLILWESVDFYIIIICSLIIFLIILFSSSWKINHNSFKKEVLFPALISSFLFWISSIPSKYLLNDLWIINAPTLYMFRCWFIALFSLLIFNFSIVWITQKQFRFIFFRWLFVIAQWVLLYYSLSMWSAWIVLTLWNLAPIFVFIISSFFLFEKPTFKKAFSALLIVFLTILLYLIK